MISGTAAMTGFRIVLSLVIFVESVLTLLNSLGSSTGSHLNKIVPWVAGTEAAAALLLLIPPTRKLGGGLLLVIFLAALIVHGPAGQLALFVYAAGIILLWSQKTVR